MSRIDGGSNTTVPLTALLLGDLVREAVDPDVLAAEQTFRVGDTLVLGVADVGIVVRDVITIISRIPMGSL